MRKITVTLALSAICLANLRAQSFDLLKDINPGSGHCISTEVGMAPPTEKNLHLVEMNGAVYFNAYDGTELGLYRTDGSGAGTVKVSPSGTKIKTNAILTTGGKLYFLAEAASASDLQLWVSDGTTAGTTMVTTFVNGNTSPEVELSDTLAGGKILLFGKDAAHGRELWVSDGTTGGTMMLNDVVAGTGDGIFYGNTAGSKYYFFDKNTNAGTDLWMTDGTVGGTVLVKNIATQGSTQIPVASEWGRKFISFNSKVYFFASQVGYGEEMMMTDGTAAGTVLATNTMYGAGIIETTGCSPVGMTIHNNLLYYVAANMGGTRLFSSDGIQATATEVDTVSNTNQNDNVWLTSYNNILYLVSRTSATGRELFRLTAGNTVEIVKDISAGSNDGLDAGGSQNRFSTRLFGYDGKLYFEANDVYTSSLSDYMDEIWSTDGTAAGTVKVGHNAPGNHRTGYTHNIISSSIGLYCVFSDPVTFSTYTYGSELYKLGASAPTGITKAGESSFTIYPNPVTTLLNIEVYGCGQLGIYSTDGRLLATQGISGSSQIDLSPYTPGIYFIQVTGSNAATSRTRVLKQ